MNEKKNEGQPSQQGSGAAPRPDQQKAQKRDKPNPDTKNPQAK